MLPVSSVLESSNDCQATRSQVQAFRLRHGQRKSMSSTPAMCPPWSCCVWETSWWLQHPCHSGITVYHFSQLVDASQSPSLIFVYSRLVLPVLPDWVAVAPAVALAFREMMVDTVPTGSNDRGIDAIVTADGLVSCSERAAALFQ